MLGKRKRRGIAVCIAALLASGCSKPQAAPATAAAVPVRVATVVQKTVPVQVTAIGNVEAYSTVAIKALVAGELTAVHFRARLIASQIGFCLLQRHLERWAIDLEQQVALVHILALALRQPV